MPSCGRGTASDRPQPARGNAFSDPLVVYSSLGLVTGPATFPAVASFSTVAGPADSTWLTLGISLPNSALRFQRDGPGFAAEYDVTLEVLDPDSTVVATADRRDRVRVSSFNETGRTEESIVHQQSLALWPGRYAMTLTVADANSSRGFSRTDTVDVPSYAGAASAALSSAIVVYRASPRMSMAASPAVIVNPRHSAAYGGRAPLVYVESYGPAASDARLEVIDAAGAVIWTRKVEWSRDSDVRHALVEIPTDVLPLGRFLVDVSDGVTSRRAPLMLTISDQWMVANLDDALRIMAYIATSSELDSLRAGSPSERRSAWDRFWTRRDPLPVTATNEYRDSFFERVRYATEAFREPGARPGWNTDRGEVYIVLGAPDQARVTSIGDVGVSGEPNAEEWIYHRTAGDRISLVFRDRTGFGRYELIPASAATFRSVAERLKRDGPDMARAF